MADVSRENKGQMFFAVEKCWIKQQNDGRKNVKGGQGGDGDGYEKRLRLDLHGDASHCKWSGGRFCEFK
jgi:hypothetical protein